MNDSLDIPFRFLLFFGDERMAGIVVVVVFVLIVRGGEEFGIHFYSNKILVNGRQSVATKRKPLTHIYIVYVVRL